MAAKSALERLWAHLKSNQEKGKENPLLQVMSQMKDRSSPGEDPYMRSPDTAAQKALRQHLGESEGDTLQNNLKPKKGRKKPLKQQLRELGMDGDETAIPPEQTTGVF